MRLADITSPGSAIGFATRTTPGGERIYSDLAITTALTL
jgi:hypothetical protein